LSYSINGKTPVAISGTADSLDKATKFPAATTWLTDAQMDTAGLATRNVGFNIPGVTLNAGDTLTLTWSANVYSALKGVAQGVDNFVLKAGSPSVPVTVDALANASDVDTGAVLSVVDVPTTLPAGVAYNAATHSFSIDPTVGAYNYLAQDQAATVTVNYGVSDGTAVTPQIVTFTVNGTNDSPVVGTVATTATEAGAPVTIDALANSSDVDTSNVLSVVDLPVNLPAGVSYNAATHSFTIDPTVSAYDNLAAGKSAIVTVNYGVSDGTKTIASSVTFTVQGTNDAAKISGTSTFELAESNSALTTSGTLSSTDVDGTTAFTAETVLGTYGNLVMGINGAWTYTASNAQNQLADGAKATDSFVVHAADGTPSSITVNITGTNDAAVITGTKTFELTETDAALTTNGTLASSDVDGTSAFQAETVTGTYGNLVMGADGAWTYTASNAQNQLADGAKATDTFVVHAADGTPSSITVNITGTNDAAVITGTKTFELTETDAALTTNGTLASSDLDGTTAFTAETVTGSYGNLVMGADGAWNYTATSAQDQLANGAKATDTFVVHAADGTPSSITVNITGANDAAVITGTKTFQLAETDAAVTTSGTLAVSDVDGANTFIAQTATVGKNGVFSIDENGDWNFTANSANDNRGDSLG
jgi:VCBS repeat-containing protein